MTVLVTGASGFLGGVLARRLRQGGEKVRILARLTSVLTHLDDLGLEVVTGTLEDKESLRPALEGVEVVYHCAAVSTDWAPWSTYHAANVLGVKNLLEATHEQGSAQRFLHVSTVDVYGYPEVPCEEDAPLRDVGLPYNRSKIQGEALVWEDHERTGLPVTVVRPCTLFGPRGKDFVVEIAALLQRRQMVLIDRGRSCAGLMYVDNCARAIIDAATSEGTVGKAYNLSDDLSVTWAEYVGALARGLGISGPSFNLPSGLALFIGRLSELVYGLLRVRQRPLMTRHAAYLLCRDQNYPIERARRDLGLRAKIHFEESIERCITWLDSEEGRQATTTV